MIGMNNVGELDSVVVDVCVRRCHDGQVVVRGEVRWGVKQVTTER